MSVLLEPAYQIGSLMSGYRIKTLGLDAGLRHGALVSTEFLVTLNKAHDDINLKLMDHEILYTWDKKSPFSLSQEASGNQISALCLELVRAIASQGVMIKNGAIKRQNISIALDWDPMSIHWASRKLQMVKMSYFIGYISSMLQMHGYPVVYISPANARELLGLPPRSEKSILWNKIQPIPGVSTFMEVPQVVKDISKEGDLMDAFLLSYLIARDRGYQAFINDLDTETHPKTLQ